MIVSMKLPHNDFNPCHYMVCHLKIMIRNELLRNKKVLLRERKRHTACRIAVASDCYSGGGTMGTPYLDLGWGTPPPGPGMGYPPTWTWDGVRPLPRPGMGYAPYPDLGWGTPLPGPEMGYPPT